MARRGGLVGLVGAMRAMASEPRLQDPWFAVRSLIAAPARLAIPYWLSVNLPGKDGLTGGPISTGQLTQRSRQYAHVGSPRTPLIRLEDF